MMKKLVFFMLFIFFPASSFADFVRIKVGTFLMGSADSENGRSFDESLHMVSLTKDFEMQTKTITQLQWIQIMGANPSLFKTKKDCPQSFQKINQIGACPFYPVESIHFSDVQTFIVKINQQNKKYVFRLPTEAEWEFAARANHGSAYFFSDDGTDFDKYVVSDRNKPARVGSKQPNDFGLYDMLGNMGQWVQDYYSYYPDIDFDKPVIDPQGPKFDDYRVVRGGDWSDYMWNHFRSASRKFVSSDEANSKIGFRLVRLKKN